VAPDNEHLLTLTGHDPDLCTNVGVTSFDRSGARELEPPACSESFVRHLRLTGDGAHAAYLVSAGDQLDIEIVELATGARRQLESPEPERGFVLGSRFTQ